MMDFNTALQKVSSFASGGILSVLQNLFGYRDNLLNPDTSIFSIREDGFIAEPRFADAQENFEFLQNMLFNGFRKNDAFIDEVFKKYVRRRTNAIFSIIDRISIVLVGNGYLSDDEWKNLEDFLLRAVTNLDEFKTVINACITCANGNKSRLAKILVLNSPLSISERKTVDGIYRGYSMLLYWCFAAYAYETLMNCPEDVCEALGILYNV